MTTKPISRGEELVLDATVPWDVDERPPAKKAPVEPTVFRDADGKMVECYLPGPKEAKRVSHVPQRFGEVSEAGEVDQALTEHERKRQRTRTGKVSSGAAPSGGGSPVATAVRKKASAAGAASSLNAVGAVAVSTLVGGTMLAKERAEEQAMRDKRREEEERAAAADRLAAERLEEK